MGYSFRDPKNKNKKDATCTSRQKDSNPQKVFLLSLSHMLLSQRKIKNKNNNNYWELLFLMIPQ